MSTWRRKAISCLPECRQEFERPDLTPIGVFMELLPALIRAHRDNCDERIKNIHQYAIWCSRQKEKKLWNAAGVAFYEHLADQEETWACFTKWVPGDVYLNIRGLLLCRMGEEYIKETDKFYKVR